MAKFIISTDSCVDKFKSILKSKNVYCIILKRITDGIATEELYDSDAEFIDFYERIKKGELPTTSQLNPDELEDYFLRIIDENPEGDIIHISLSGGLSNTYYNSAMAASNITEKTGRRIYSIDSLSATLGMGMMVDRLIELRDSGTDAEDAVKAIEDLRDRQQLWAMVGDLFHLKRGGRIGGFKAAVGTLLNVRPVLIINSEGKLAIERTVKGTKKCIDYLISRFVEEGIDKSIDYTKSKVYIIHSAPEEAELLRTAVAKLIPAAQIEMGMIGPIIGTHVGAGAVALVFEATKRF